MNRQDPAPDCAVDLEIVNDRAIEDAGRALADFLRTLSSSQTSEPAVIGCSGVTSVGGCDA